MGTRVVESGALMKSIKSTQVLAPVADATIVSSVPGCWPLVARASFHRLGRQSTVILRSHLELHIAAIKIFASDDDPCRT